MNERRFRLRNGSWPIQAVKRGESLPDPSLGCTIPCMDTLSPERRSECMRSVRGEDTTPELAVRRLVHQLGFRFRLHVRSLPGKPDLVFPSRSKIIMVHGCFWHGHCCRGGRNRPTSNVTYWSEKLERNRKRDRYVNRELKRLGWSVLRVWECELRNESRVMKKLVQFLGDGR